MFYEHQTDFDLGLYSVQNTNLIVYACFFLKRFSEKDRILIGFQFETAVETSLVIGLSMPCPCLCLCLCLWLVYVFIERFDHLIYWHLYFKYPKALQY